MQQRAHWAARAPKSPGQHVPASRLPCKSSSARKPEGWKWGCSPRASSSSGSRAPQPGEAGTELAITVLSPSDFHGLSAQGWTWTHPLSAHPGTCPAEGKVFSPCSQPKECSPSTLKSFHRSAQQRAGLQITSTQA